MESLSLESKVYKSIQEVSREEWDLINSPGDIFHTYTFLKDIEDAKVENSAFWYMMIYNEKKLIATAVLSAFIINLDIFIPTGAFIRGVRKIWPGFLKIKILMCGIPASLGQKNIVIVDMQYKNQVIKIVSDEMNKISKEGKIKYMAFKEFKENEIADYDHLKHNGYFKALSLPYMRIKVKWGDFESYLSDLRHGYKRQILNSLKKINLTGGFQLRNILNGSDSKVPCLILADSTVCTPELFYKSYLEVMNRAVSKLETLNFDFFKNYFESHKEKLIFIVLAEDQTIYGSAILVPHESELTFALIGKHGEKDKYDTYFNLITAIVKYGIENNFETINMGQTSYYPKQRVGAKPENEYIYFRSGKIMMHTVLRLLNKVLFPETKIQNVNVFKNTN